jgi:hypothetical protein
MYQHFNLQVPPKFTQSGIFGLKVNHLETLLLSLLLWNAAVKAASTG